MTLQPRSRAAVAAAGAALTLWSAPAFATPPQPADQTPINLKAGEACAFPVQLIFTGKTKTTDLPGGRTLETGPGQDATITNLVTGRSVRLSVTGAFHTSTAANGNVVTVATGRNLQLDPMTGFVLTEGHFTYVSNAAGALIAPVVGTGRILDVCAMVA
jgi:hypothetical protein